MDKELTKKMEVLLARIEREDKRASKSFVVSMVCRIFITLLLVGSLTFIGVKFSELSQPANVAIALNEQVLATIPDVHVRLNKELPKQAKVLAASTVKQIHRVIPMLGDMLETHIESQFERVMDHYKSQREQVFENLCSKVIDKIKKDKDLVNDETLAKELATQLSNECNREAQEIINNAFFSEIDKLQARVEKLRSTPYKIMTRKQAAKKHLIVCWIYLIDNKKIDDESIVGNAASLLGEIGENFISTQN